MSSCTLNAAEKQKKEPKQKSERFSCSGKDKCKEMNTCAEAKFYLNECGVRKLDRDKDGVPCESLCN
ncbi:MAG: excalibur calcium-binding domain-containing protein [Pseudomonadota bacterium]